MSNYSPASQGTQIGYGFIHDTDDTRAKGLAGKECKVLVNSKPNQWRVYVKVASSLIGGKWKGPYFVNKEDVTLTDTFSGE